MTLQALPLVVFIRHGNDSSDSGAALPTVNGRGTVRDVQVPVAMSTCSWPNTFKRFVELTVLAL